MRLCKVCNLEDFNDPDLRAAMNGAFPGDTARYPDRYPEQAVHRKTWELAQAYRALLPVSDQTDRRYLGVGAGIEPTIYWLTQYGEVHATDLYAAPGPWTSQAVAGMLTNPAQYAPPSPWQPHHLIVQHMDARALRYPDAHFDGVFSSSSIEHMGTLDQIAQVAREIGRVLKPGGIASLSTEWKIDGAGHGWEGVTLFDEALLHQVVIEPSGCTLVDALDRTVSAASLATAQQLETIVRLIEQKRPTPRPHVVLQHKGYVFTSVHIALRKREVT